MRHWFLPSMVVFFAILSILVLRSVAPSLAPRQLIGFVLGLLAFAGLSRQLPRQLEHWSPMAYAGLLVLLVIPLLIGRTTRGIAAWIEIGDWFVIQPSQLAIPVVALVVARFVSQRSLKRLANVAQVAVLIGVPAILIALEPDLGTLVVYLVSLSAVIFLSDIEWKTILVAVGLGLVSMVLSWLFVLQPYQKSRITSFMSQDQDQQGASYNARQAQIAVGAGQLTGKGLGQGVQSHLRFLPERQTDFIFASLAEELGFLGSVLIISAYAGVVGYVYWLSWRLSLVGRYFAYAIMAQLGVQILINVGMNMGLMPITGITLPFLSYGSSSIVGMCMLLGVVQSYANWTEQRRSLHLG